MRLVNIPFVIITISTILGVILGYCIHLDTLIMLVCFGFLVVVLGIVWKRSKKIFYNGYSFQWIMVLVFITFGVVLVHIHDPKNYHDHYTHQLNTKNVEQELRSIQFHIKERLKPSRYYSKYIVSVHYIDEKATSGKLLLKIPKDSANTILDVGDMYTTVTHIKPTPKPLNPYQFDYANHLRKQSVFHEIILPKNRLILHPKKHRSIFRVADQLRKHINSILSQQHSFTTTQLSIINALLLGQRQDVDQDTFKAYRDAGAIHILAVSGLHIGILLLFLSFILKPLHLAGKWGKYISGILTIVFLWFFAIIAGLSPSVLRAVTMFSFITIGMYTQSKTSIYNSLFISIFLLLCYDPLSLFSVGFQLSYLAVFSIVYIQPLLAKQFSPHFYPLKKIWETFTVTVAAQIGILPVTLFYFHQFPFLFFVSNLLIIPFLGAILVCGILVILLASLDLLPHFMASLFGYGIDVMNYIVIWTSQQKSFLITNIPFSWRMLILLYFVIISLVLLLKSPTKRSVLRATISCIIIIGVMNYEKYIIADHEELIIFNNYRNTTIGVLKNRKLKIYSTAYISSKTQEFLFTNYLVQHHAILDTCFRQLKNTYEYKQYKILIIDSSSTYSIPKLHPDILLLSNSPKIHLERVLDSLQPKQVIADGSNYKSYINRWKESCKKQNIPFHQINKKGAFILR